MFVCSNQDPDLHLPSLEDVPTLKEMLDKFALDKVWPGALAWTMRV